RGRGIPKRGYARAPGREGDGVPALSYPPRGTVHAENEELAAALLPARRVGDPPAVGRPLVLVDARREGPSRIGAIAPGQHELAADHAPLPRENPLGVGGELEGGHLGGQLHRLPSVGRFDEELAVADVAEPLAVAAEG